MTTSCSKQSLLKLVTNTEQVLLLLGCCPLLPSLFSQQLCFAIMGSWISSTVCEVIGLAYPTWASFKALESTNKDEHAQWLTYWVIYAFFRIVELFADVFIGWFPFYYTLKVLFLIVLQLPQLQVPRYIYVVHVRPLLKKKEKEMDEMVGVAFKTVKAQATSLIKDGASIISQQYVEGVTNSVVGTEAKN